MKETTYYIKNLPLRIAVLADLHEKPYGFLDQVRRRSPGLICIPGDVIERFRQEKDELVASHVTPFFSECTSIARTCFSLGNHEYMLCGEDLELIRSTGTVVLDNSWVDLGGLSVGGLSSAYYNSYSRYRSGRQDRYPLREKLSGKARQELLIPDTSWLADLERQKGFRLLLSHHPEYYPQYLKDRKIDLILSGHAHGGQIRLFGRGLFAPGQGVLPKYTSGVFDGKMVISRGLANNAHFIPRLFNPREIVFLEPAE